MKIQKVFNLKSKILSNKKVGEHYWHCLLETPEIANHALAGQFVSIRLSGGVIPLLRRPFSIHKVNGRNIEILYEVIGQGTKMFSGKRTGEYLDLIGPLGNGFNYGLRTTSYESQILVAGGMGVAPMVFLAKKLSPGRTLVLIGARKKRQILCEKEFKNLGCSVKIATDDGSTGFKGKVTDLLRSLLSTIYACGPKPMLREVSRISKEFKIPAEISLEEHMACGIGACLGCVVKTKTGVKRVCKEGPVFNADEIAW
ncbi:MAG: dihydroorotate dehydrogenase electron transfer subunit [Candidatus Omnitrophica bacterium]|nr:dihydroorotate dehydrogenase electron transfer subunit [Candidatus Omnitrophota bacterium]